MTEFSELGLSPSTLQAVADTGYTTATPIQAQAIPVALAGQDVLGIAQTGTGKTAAFTLPLIDKLMTGRAKARMPRALVIAPTRELADQVASSFEKYAKGTKLSWALLIGGVSFGDQEKKLDRGVDVLIATPGRLLDHFERGKLLMTGVQFLVVDEADRMLDMGFIPDIERIFKMTPPKKQTLFFSATMPPEITRLTKQFLKDPVRIEVARPATTNANITQLLVKVPSSDPKAKRLALRALIEKAGIETGIVFCNRKTEVDIVAKSLRSHGFDAAAIHGDLDQSQRMKTLAAFRDGSLKILVASDVAARGLDIPAVSHVFNYDVPHHADDYVHRIGRTGRAGRTGITYMLVTPADDKGFDKVVKLIGSTPDEEKLDLDYSGAVTVRREGDKDRKRGRGAPAGRDRGERETGERSARGGRGSRVREIEGESPSEDAVVEAVAAETADAPAEAREERAPRARRERKPRGERTPRAEAVETAEAEAVAPAPRERTRPEREPRAEREARPAREARPEREVRPERESRPAQPVRGVQPVRGREDDDDRRVIGFGNDVPAFLMRAPPRLPKTPTDD